MAAHVAVDTGAAVAVGPNEMMRRNIAIMNALEGFEVVIICCSSGLQAAYWQERLEAGRGSVLPVSSMVLAVEEDWPGGAGNGKLETVIQARN
jgi:hypothetical protein